MADVLTISVERKTLDVKLGKGEDVYHIPLRDHMTRAEVRMFADSDAAIGTPKYGELLDKDFNEYCTAYVPADVLDALTLTETANLISAWVEASSADSEVTPGE